MPKDRFATSGVTRYTLADGEDWVELKNCLTWAEDVRLDADSSIVRTVTGIGEDGEEKKRQIAEIDLGIYRLRNVLAYLTAWSFTAPDGKTIVPISMEMIKALDTATGEELAKLVSRHVKEQELKNSPQSTKA